MGIWNSKVIAKRAHGGGLTTPHGDLEPASASIWRTRSRDSQPLMGIWNQGLGVVGGHAAGLTTPHGDLEHC